MGWEKNQSDMTHQVDSRVNNIPHVKGGEALENGTSKASPQQNAAGTHVPQVLVSGPHLLHETGCSSATQYCGLSTPWLQHEGTIMEL